MPSWPRKRIQSDVRIRHPPWVMASARDRAPLNICNRPPRADRSVTVALQ